MTAIYDALRRDLDQLIHTTASRTAARARWIVFRDQLHLHLAAEHTAMWRPARTKLTGDPRGQALLEAMEDEHQLIGPLRTVTDDAFTMGCRPRAAPPPADQATDQADQPSRHEEADALPLIGHIMSPPELGAIARAIRGGPAECTLPWALAHASPHART
jgi:Hemerythrin HHE cation binding domain